MLSTRRHGKHAFTLLELLVVIGIVSALLGLLLPAVLNARESANVLKCENNLKQITLGFHNAADEHAGLMPPGIGAYPQANDTSYGTGFFHILPYLEQNNLHEQAQLNGYYYAGYNEVRANKIDLFVCLSDPSASNGVMTTPNGPTYGVMSYAGNTQVFCKVYTAPPYTGFLQDPQGWPRLGPASFPDGQSTTILFAEKYAQCTNYAWPIGGTLWAYDVTGATVQPLHPAFAVSWNPSLSIGSLSIFQVRPPMTDCDPTRTSTNHHVMPVAMADGSVQKLPANISGDIWWALCTPRGGEVIPNIW